MWALQNRQQHELLKPRTQGTASDENALGASPKLNEVAPNEKTLSADEAGVCIHVDTDAPAPLAAPLELSKESSVEVAAGTERVSLRARQDAALGSADFVSRSENAGGAAAVTVAADANALSPKLNDDCADSLLAVLSLLLDSELKMTAATCARSRRFISANHGRKVKHSSASEA